jgi:mono/diheme cytochrome c family protein
VVLAVTASFALVVVACGGGSSSPDAGAAQSPMPRGALAEDAQVLEGRKVFAANCATCHGVSGGGGVGPSFNDGKLLRDFADAGAQEAFVKMGKGVMPSFSSLGSKRIAAVVRYEREVLSKQQ